MNTLHPRIGYAILYGCSFSDWLRAELVWFYLASALKA
jgi:hypothetical protein